MECAERRHSVGWFKSNVTFSAKVKPKCPKCPNKNVLYVQPVVNVRLLYVLYSNVGVLYVHNLSV